MGTSFPASREPWGSRDEERLSDPFPNFLPLYKDLLTVRASGKVRPCQQLFLGICYAF